MSNATLLANYRRLEAELQRTQLVAAELATTAARATAEQQQACTRLAEVEAELAKARGKIVLAIATLHLLLPDAKVSGRTRTAELIEETLAALKGPA